MYHESDPSGRVVSGPNTHSRRCGMTIPSFSRRTVRIAALAILGVASIAVTQRVLASDHQDTPEVELNPRMDLNDVYAFPGSSADRVALVLTTSSRIAGQAAS